MRTFKVNMIPTGMPLYIRANQFERGDEWRFQLYYEGARYTIPSGAEVRICGTKKDGAAYEHTCTVQDNEAAITVTEQMTAAYGWSTVELLVVNGDVVLYTANFIVDCEPAAVQGELVDSDIPDSIVTADGDVYLRIDIALDDTLSIADKPADAKAVGDAIQAARDAASAALASAIAAERATATEDDRTLQRQITSIQNDIADAVHSEEVQHIVKIMRADYDALPVKQPDTLYIVQDD